MVTPKEAYGSGWKLAGNSDIEAGRAKYPFDYVVNPDGDFAIVSGVRYLIQGIARRFVGEASELLGQVLDADTQADLELVITDLATQDDRVREIRNPVVREVSSAPNAIGIGLTIVADRADRVVFAAEPAAPSTNG